MARNRYDVDETLEDSFDLNQVKRLANYIKPYKKEMGFVIFMMLSSSALTMLIPIFFQKIMDVCIPAKDMKQIFVYAGLTLVIALYTAFSLALKIKHMSSIGQNIIHDLRYDIFKHLQELPFSYFDDKPHGKIQVRVVNYVNSLSDLLSNGIVNTLTDLCNLIFILIFMLIEDVRLTLICLTGLPLLALVIVFIKKRQRRAWQIQSNKQSNLNAYIAESIGGYPGYPVLCPGRPQRRHFQQFKHQLPQRLDACRKIQLYPLAGCGHHFHHYHLICIHFRCALYFSSFLHPDRRRADCFYRIHQPLLAAD